MSWRHDGEKAAPGWWTGAKRNGLPERECLLFLAFVCIHAYTIWTDGRGGHALDDEWTDLVKRDMLTRRVTLDEYFAESMELVREGRVAKSAIEADMAELEARAQPGDEW